jgi:hypothetical protein
MGGYLVRSAAQPDETVSIDAERSKIDAVKPEKKTHRYFQRVTVIRSAVDQLGRTG